MLFLAFSFSFVERKSDFETVQSNWSLMLSLGQKPWTVFKHRQGSSATKPV